MTSAATSSSPVPVKNSAANTTAAEVIGNKTDDHDGDSIYAMLDTLEDHFHGTGKVYPTLAGGVVVTSGVGAWVLGAFQTVVPASTITDDFDIHHVTIENLSAVAVYELVLYYGPTDIECCRIRIVKTAVQDSTDNIQVMTPLIPANSQIRAKCADSVGSKTVTMSIQYHTY